MIERVWSPACAMPTVRVEGWTPSLSAPTGTVARERTQLDDKDKTMSGRGPPMGVTVLGARPARPSASQA